MSSMVRRLLEKAARYVAPGCAALLVATGTVRADDADELAQMKAKLEQLQKQVEYQQKVIDGGLVPAGADEQAVERIVREYLKQEKKAEEKKPDKPAADAGSVVGSDLNFTGGAWNNTPVWATRDGAFRVQLRGRWHNDWGWNTADPILTDPVAAGGAPGNFGESLDDGVIFRRARLGVQGTIWETFDYVAEFDFAGNQVTNTGASGVSVALREVWMGTRTPIGFVRLGHFKEYFSLEQLTSSRFLTFIERSIIDGPVDDILAYNSGASLSDTYLDERGSWAFGIFRHTDASGNDIGDGEYNVTGRVTFLPLWENNGRHFVHLGLGASYHVPGDNTLAGTTADRGGERWRTRPYRIDPVAFLDTGTLFPDDFIVVGPEFAVVLGPFSLQAEYHKYELRDTFTAGVNRGDVEFSGYYVFASWFLTGENRVYGRTGTSAGTFGRVIPHENFFAVRTGEDGCCGQGLCCGKGAWEIAARWAHLDLADGFFAAPGAGVPAATGELDQFTIGLNWYWNPNMKVQFNYEWLDLERNGLVAANQPQGEVRTFVVRFAWDF